MAIQDVETFGCTEPEDDGKGGSCKFWTYYSQPDWTEKIELWIKRYQRKTWYLLDISLPVATAKGFKVSAECVRVQYTNDPSIRHLKLRCCAADICTESEFTFTCSPEIPSGPLPPYPVIRDLSVYACDKEYCGFYIFFNPPPDDVTVSVYLDDALTATDPPVEIGGLSRISTIFPEGKQVKVHLEFTLGIQSSRSSKVLFDVSLPEGQETDLTSVGSSNIKAAGFLKWAGLYGTGDTRAKDLDEVAVGTLLRDEQMSETEARSRFAKMGYSQDDVDYLIILNLPG